MSNLIPLESQNDLAPLLQEILEELREQKAILAGIMTKEQPKPAKKLLTVAEAAEYLRISKRTLYMYVRKDKVPYRKPNGRVLFVPGDLDSFMELNKHISKAEEVQKAKGLAFKSVKLNKRVA